MSIPTGTDRSSGSQRVAPDVVRTQRWAPEHPGPARLHGESGTEVPLRGRSGIREPELQSSAGSPDRGSRRRSPVRKSSRRIQSRDPMRLTTAGSPDQGSRGRSPVCRSYRIQRRSRSREPTTGRGGSGRAGVVERGGRGKRTVGKESRSRTRSPWRILTLFR